MIQFPNAKINLGLTITEKRPDGFHNIESCFYPIQLTDVLEISLAPTTSFRTSGIPIPGDNGLNNLTLKAYELLRNDYDLAPIEIHLLKGIPIGAGLGGGSSDASFCIRAVDTLFNIGLTIEEQQDYARLLGSDCAFFIENKPTFCTGKGDQFEEIKVDLKGKWLTLINPGIHISTQEAYSGVRPNKAAIPLREALQQPLSTWAGNVVNDFEYSIFPKHPAIAKLKESLYSQGAIYASMSGSGSSVFGIFEKQPFLHTKYSPHFVWEGELVS